STMLLLLEALKEESLEPPAEPLVAQLSEQTERCRDELEQLKQEASAAAEPAPQWQPFDQLAELLRQRLLLRAPDRLRQFTLEGSQPAPRL
ncbi:MAG TPA: hypothetical protein PK724_04310, partial [Pseudomonadales bacterium]|nr:hypothetical protein [Pseudomonadales bacterium]